MNKKIMDAKVVEEENRKLDIEREDILEEGSVVRIQNRVLGRRKLENIGEMNCGKLKEG